MGTHQPITADDVTEKLLQTLKTNGVGVKTMDPHYGEVWVSAKYWVSLNTHRVNVSHNRVMSKHRDPLNNGSELSFIISDKDGESSKAVANTLADFITANVLSYRRELHNKNVEALRARGIDVNNPSAWGDAWRRRRLAPWVRPPTSVRRRSEHHPLFLQLVSEIAATHNLS